MAISVLAQANALNPGSDLWIIPDTANSAWNAKLDWYLNFQISKSVRHEPLKAPEFIQGVLQETGLETPSLSVPATAPLMIASQGLLPNKWVVILKWENNPETWVQSCFQVWSQLQEPSLRIFLPPGQSTGTFLREWKNHHRFEDFTVVLD